MKRERYIPWNVVAKRELKRQGITYQMSGRNQARVETVRAIGEMIGMTLSEMAGEDKYFIIEEEEREAIDILRSIPGEERLALLALLRSRKPSDDDRS